MVDLPESMKTGGFDPQETAASLEGERNRARLQQQLSQPPLNVPQAGAAPTPAGVNPQAGAGQPDSGAAAVARARGGAPAGSYAARRQVAQNRKAQAKKQEEDGNPDYPNPLNLRSFVVFGAIALSQDLLPLLLDLIGIGWIIEYLHLAITWPAYWFIIIRWAPKSMKRKFWQRTLLVTCVGWIPVVGQFIPEWTATAIGAYVVITMYQRRKAYEATGKRSDRARGGGKKTPTQPAEQPQTANV